MKQIIMGALLAVGLFSLMPASASAQSFGVGPGGVEFDSRTRRQRERDFDRAEMRRDMRREERREMRRDEDRAYRRGY